MLISVLTQSYLETTNRYDNDHYESERNNSSERKHKLINFTNKLKEKYEFFLENSFEIFIKSTKSTSYEQYISDSSIKPTVNTSHDRLSLNKSSKNDYDDEDLKFK